MAHATLRLAKLHRTLDFLDCDCFSAHCTRLTWWRTRRRWRWRRRHAPLERGPPPPRFCWQQLPDRLRREGEEGGCLHSLRTQLELVEEAPWFPFPRNVVRHIEQYLGSAEMDSLFVMQVDKVVQWANVLRFTVRPRLEAEAAKLRRERQERELRR